MKKIPKEYYRFKMPNSKSNFFGCLQISDNTRDFLKASIDEYESLRRLFGFPKKVLDIGCGLGRSSVFLKNMCHWNGAKFYLADFNENVQYPKGRTNIPLGYFDDAKPVPFNSLGATMYFCTDNDLVNVKTIDLSTNNIKKLRNVDLVYSFHSVGYHWSIEKAIKKYNLNDVTTPNAKLIFGVRNKKVIENEKATDYKEQKKVIGNIHLTDIIHGTLFQDYWVYRKDNDGGDKNVYDKE